MNEENDLTVIFVTHDLDEALFLGSRIIGLSQYWKGDPEETGIGARIVTDRDLNPVLGEAGSREAGIIDAPEFRALRRRVHQDVLDPEHLQHSKEFDIEGEERKEFFAMMFSQGKITLGDGELTEVMPLTDWYSNRDLDFLIREVKSARRDKPGTSVLEVLETWSASKGIVTKRHAQSLIAASTSSYPALVPARFKSETFGQELARAKMLLGD